MTQISTRYETMGPICTRRIYINPQQHLADNPVEARNAAERRNDSPYHQRGESSDYAFALLFGMVGILLSNVYVLPKLPTFITHNRYHHFFFRHLTFFVCYVWSKQHPFHRVNFFGVNFHAAYLPYAYLVMGYVLDNGQSIPLDIIHGMFVGHVYYYLACVVPQVLGGRRVVLSTPIALVDFCNWLEGRGPVGVDGRRDDGNGDVGAPVLVDVDGVIGG